MPIVFIALLLILAPLGAFAETPLWQDVNPASIAVRGARPTRPNSYRTVRLNTQALGSLLAQAPLEFTSAARQKTVIMEVPMPDGKLARFRIEESPVLAPHVAAELPGVKTFSGQGIDDPAATARFDWMPSKGFHGYVLTQAGTVYIDPYQENDREHYLVYYKHQYGGGSRRSSFRCDTDTSSPLVRPDYKSSLPITDFANGADLRTYRIAIAGTGEYTAFHGGQANALAVVTTAVNRLIGIYRREAAISFTLVSGTNILFPDAATDPYTNAGGGGQLTVNQTQLDTIIGTANYDIGHLFVTSDGGIATTPCVCTGQKAQGLSGLDMPTGDPFVVDFVAHEIGHQFSGDHSYNNSGDSVCTTRSANDAFEPASGATIMSYVGQCSPRDLASASLDLFTVQSLAQVINYRNDAGGGGSCGTLTTPGNTPPVLGALANFTIPRNTPFALTATATDANDPANQLTYSWEENDLGPESGTATSPDSDADGMARPIFRILPPSNAGATRNFPSLPYILNNANVPPVTYSGTSPTGAVCTAGDCITGEILPSIARVMNFRVTVRDNNAAAGGATDAGMTVTVNGASGPFRVTSPNTAITATGGMPFTVTWDVAGTAAAPVSAANVRISISTDGGMTFPTVLANSTANDGSESVTLSNTATTTARIKVEGVGNIFFDISDVNFTITGGGPTPTPTPGATPGSAANISTRLPVGTGDNILITGFIITGPAGSTKRVLVRGIGPSTNVPGALADPTLELRDQPGALLASNDNWRTTQIGGIITGDQVAEIQASTIAPTNDAESALIGTLAPGNYTAQIRGANNTTGIGLAEAYDLSLGSAARLANVSTRGFVQTGDNLMIGGFIIVTNPVRVVIRAIGPSLTGLGVPNALADPTLELRGGNGMLILANDNWRDTQAAEIMATTLQPTNDLESAIVMTLQPGNYTALLRGSNNGIGNGLVEVYALPTLQ